MNKRNNNKWDLAEILLIVFAFAAFWPLGVFLILRKLGLLSQSKKPDSNSVYSLRQSKYQAMTEGQESESIEYLASAVGVSYESALREIQQMIRSGAFGSEAYINYIDKTIVLPKNRTSPAKKAQAAKTAAQKKSSAPSGAPAGKRSTVNTKQNVKKASSTGLNTVLLVIGIILSLMGVAMLGNAIDMLSWIGYYSGLVSDLVGAAFFLSGGAASFLTRHKIKRRSARFIKYLSIIHDRDMISLKELSSVAGVSERTLKRDLEVMFDKEMLPTGAYTDIGAGLLIINPGARPKKEEEPVTKPEEDNEDRYRKILREIRELNDAIPGEEISARIDEIEDLTAQIFNAVEKNPEKLPQIKSFMSYYLPTTLKLLRSYAAFEQSGAGGENVRSAKEQIESILDTLVDGFKKQLDKLYETEAMDISSDIDVLENMLKRDGLSEDEFGQVRGGH